MAMQAHRSWASKGTVPTTRARPRRENTPFVIDLPRSDGTPKKAILEVDQKVAKGLGQDVSSGRDVRLHRER